MKQKVLLLDIEGTTTPLSFVHDVLFPYAREHAEALLRTAPDDPAVDADLRALAEEGAVDPDSIDEVLDVVRQLMHEDRKSTALKSLQGKIWAAGYADGSLLATVFDDVRGVIADAVASGVRVAIYSSGSIAAQVLLFRHSTAGDLTGYLDGYFDTTTGPKKEASSYERIARALGVAPGEILFCTDNLDEAIAARLAGVRAVIVVRPGNPPLPAHDFETWRTLEPAREQYQWRIP